jgi:choline dehydrogenase-like flavoprotein
MANLNTKLNDSNTYDAIVIGSGVSGGWAAKELTEKGLKTLILEKGRMVNHLVDYPTMNNEPWDFEHRGSLTREQREEHHMKLRGIGMGEDSVHFFASDKEQPYQEVKRFDWVRADVVGGRSLLWGRQVYRWSDIDFEANAKEGIAVDWPIRYKDIAPWYSYVEKFAGVSGEKLGLPQLPDGEFLPPMELNVLEKHFRKEIEAKYKRTVTIGRVAHLTEPQPHHLAMGRGKCQHRNKCQRGCPFGAYFSSNSTTIPPANKTGNLSVRPHSVVHSIIYDAVTQKAKGVKIIDRDTNKEIDFFAKIIFVCASALGSTQILLNSTSDRFPNGLGNDSGELGHNLMDHHYHVGAVAAYEGMPDGKDSGSRPNGLFIPKYVNINASTKQKDFVRGWDYQGIAERQGWSRAADGGGVGVELKNTLKEQGPWVMRLMGFGETLPFHGNMVSLSKEHKDKWGIPQLVFDATIQNNELSMRKKMKADAGEMLSHAGCKDIIEFDIPGSMGNAIHEMGTARMGRDPKTSVLNGFNQVHACKNVFVTDGACMTSANCVNPSITYMALTARAADHAVSELKKSNL